MWGSGPNDVWVLGSQLRDDGWYVMVALHSTNGGQTWSAAGTLLVNASRPYVLDVHGLPSGEAYAVGRTSADERLTMHLNAAGSWVQEDFGYPQRMGTIEGVRAVAPGEVYGVGSRRTTFAREAVIWKRNESGSAWNEWTDGEPDGTQFYGIGGDLNGGTYVVGSGRPMRYLKGTSWTETGPAFTSPLRSVWGTPQGDVYAVGEDGVILHGVR